MWLIFAALTVIFWGTAETVFKKSTKGDEHSVAHLLAYNGVFFGITGVIYMLIIYGFSFDFFNVLKYLPIAIIYILSMWSYYNAMKAIKISIVSPIVNTSCLITVLLSIFILGQYPDRIHIVAIGLIIFSLIMLSINKTPEDDIEIDFVGATCGRLQTIAKNSTGGAGEQSSPLQPMWKRAKFGIYIFGLLFAFGYFILDGVASFLDEFSLKGNMAEHDLLISYALIYLVVGIGCYVYLKIKDGNYRFELDKPKLIGSALETAGQYTFIYALGAGFASIVSPFVASYSVVTIILSRLFLKEKLKPKQYLWIVLVLIGIVLLSIE